MRATPPTDVGAPADDAETGAAMRITTRVDGREAPRNVGLLFFSDDPERWFRGARIEVVRFTGAAGRVQDERVFRGPLPRQLRNCLLHLEGLSESHVEKRPREGRVRAWVSHPRDAVREAVVNAVRHRSYRPDVVEPTKVFIHPDRVEVVSHPGPVPGVDPAHPNAAGASPPRNPRVGEFLEELGLAGGRPGGLPPATASARSAFPRWRPPLGVLAASSLR